MPSNIPTPQPPLYVYTSNLLRLKRDAADAARVGHRHPDPHGATLRAGAHALIKPHDDWTPLSEAQSQIDRAYIEAFKPEAPLAPAHHHATLTALLDKQPVKPGAVDDLRGALKRAGLPTALTQRLADLLTHPVHFAMPTPILSRPAVQETINRIIYKTTTSHPVSEGRTDVLKKALVSAGLTEHQAALFMTRMEPRTPAVDPDVPVPLKHPMNRVALVMRGENVHQAFLSEGAALAKKDAEAKNQQWGPRPYWVQTIPFTPE